MYGLESAQFNNTTKGKLDTFYLKGIRQICKLETTYGQTVMGKERTNTNEVVLNTAMDMCKQKR